VLTLEYIPSLWTTSFRGCTAARDAVRWLAERPSLLVAGCLLALCGSFSPSLLLESNPNMLPTIFNYGVRRKMLGKVPPCSCMRRARRRNGWRVCYGWDREFLITCRDSKSGFLRLLSSGDHLARSRTCDDLPSVHHQP